MLDVSPPTLWIPPRPAIIRPWAEPLAAGIFGSPIFESPVFGGKSGGFVGYSTEYTTPGTSTISIPSGASTVTVECIAAGGGTPGGGGGGGGGYAKKNTYSVSGLSGIYISVPNTASGATNGSPCFAKENSSGGADIARATGGNKGDGGTGGAGTVGDVLRTGGTGGGAGSGGGGGAAGPTSNGSNASGGTGGTGGGSPAGAGGNSGVNGSNYGGGAGGLAGNTGAQGWLKLTWA